MNQDHASSSEGMYRAEKSIAAYLVSKVMVEMNGKFSQFEINVAKLLVEADVQWPSSNTLDFLYIVAGCRQPGADLFQECYAALTWEEKEASREK